jgi:HK97 gp10 family phage protein
MALKVDILGKDEIKRGINEYGKRVGDKLKKATQKHALNIAKSAKQNLNALVYATPESPSYRRTGLLRSSIQPRFLRNGWSVEVYTNVFYAPFVEFGTGQRGQATIPGDVPLPVGWVYGTVNGMAARPFLYPAWDAERQAFIDDITNILRTGGK